jgi:hypothetical protein
MATIAIQMEYGNKNMKRKLAAKPTHPTASTCLSFFLEPKLKMRRQYTMKGKGKRRKRNGLGGGIPPDISSPYNVFPVLLLCMSFKRFKVY